ncbi:MAG: hypothetical protein HY686_05170 [Chloroflexi bacterium]|nr:hypothetical protein [Chloroflexota bacterium]
MLIAANPQDYTALAGLLEGSLNGFVVTLAGPNIVIIRQNLSVQGIVVLVDRPSFQPEELRLLELWLDAGGRMLFLGGGSISEKNQLLLRGIGVQFNGERVTGGPVEDGAIVVREIQRSQLFRHPVTQGVNTVVIPVGVGLGDYVGPPTVSRTEASRARVILVGEPHHRSGLYPAVPPLLMVNDEKRAVVLISWEGSTPFANAYLGRGDNQALALNALRWLRGDEVAPGP